MIYCLWPGCIKLGQDDDNPFCTSHDKSKQLDQLPSGFFLRRGTKLKDLTKADLEQEEAED